MAVDAVVALHYGPGVTQNRLWKRRWLVAAAVTFLLYLIVGFFVVPPIARTQIEEKAGAALKRTVTVEKVRFNPLVFSAAVEGLRVADHDGEELASWKRAYVNFDPLTSLFRWEWHLGAVELLEPRGRLVVASDGRLNIADLLETAPEQPPAQAEATEPAAFPRIGIGRVRIENWAVTFADDSRRSPFRTVLGPMTFELTDLTTKTDGESPYSLLGTTDTGETFAWTGTIDLVPFGSVGAIEFKGISLPKHAPYAEEFHRAEVRGGTVSLATGYEVRFGSEAVIRLAETQLSINGLALASQGEPQSAVSFVSLDLDMPAADVMARTAEVENVTVTGLDIRAERRADGSIDLLDWLPPAAPTDEPPATLTAEPETGAGPAASVRVAKIEVVDGRLRVVDQTTPRPALLLLDQISLVATNAGTDLDREIGVEAKLRWDEGGTVATKGTVRLLPLAAALDLDISGVELAPLDPFIEPQADVRIRDGLLRLAGHVDLTQNPGAALQLTWTGDVGIEKLVTADGRLGSDLIGWKALAFNGTRVSLEPLSFSAKEIALTEPRVELAVAKDGTFNLMVALRRDAPAAEEKAETTEVAPTPPAPAAKTSERVAEASRQSLPFQATIEAINISGGLVRVNDQSVGRGFITELREFGGSIKGLSSENLARADVDLSARLDGSAPLRITGSINPLAEDKFSDISVLFSNIDLPIFSPYSGRFLGQKVQKGKLRVDLGYKVSQNMLSGENRVLFDQFYLGEKVPSPDAIKLPIGLALALLRDRQGQIKLDVPVRGNLDDPDFKYGRVVWQAIGNIIVKAATSPFSMLGGLLGGGARDTDLSYIDFASGSNAIAEAADKKLELLAKALYERPALRLEINAPASPASDRAGLLEVRLNEMLRARKAAQLGASSAAGDEVTPEEMDGLIRAMFVDLFPEEAARAVDPNAPTSAASTASESAASPTAGDGAGEEKGGLLTRIFGGLFGGKRDEPREISESTAPVAAAGEVGAGDATAAAAPPPYTVDEMRARILGTIVLSDGDFEMLAHQRATGIRDRILAGGQVKPERVFLIDSAAIPEGGTAATEGTRVFFGLQ